MKLNFLQTHELTASCHLIDDPLSKHYVIPRDATEYLTCDASVIPEWLGSLRST